MLPALQWSRVRRRSFRKEAAKNKRQRDGIGCSGFPQEEGVCIGLVTNRECFFIISITKICVLSRIFLDILCKMQIFSPQNIRSLVLVVVKLFA